MKRLLRADLFKQKRSTTLKACLILAFLIGILMAVLYNIAANQLHANYDEYVDTLVKAGFQRSTAEEIYSEVPESILTDELAISGTTPP